MTEASRRAYLALGRAFVTIGGVVALGSLLDRAWGWGFFSGSPLGTAAFLVVVGALLLWTVRQADAGATAGPADAGSDAAPDAPPESAVAAPLGLPPTADDERP